MRGKARGGEGVRNAMGGRAPRVSACGTAGAHASVHARDGARGGVRAGSPAARPALERPRTVQSGRSGGAKKLGRGIKRDHPAIG